MSKARSQSVKATAVGETYPVNPEARYLYEPQFGEKGIGPDQLESLGEIVRAESTMVGALAELTLLIAKLKARREAMGLSLTDVSERSGLTRQVVSKLENGHTINPTLATLYRYALAVGATVTLGVQEEGPHDQSDARMIP